MQKIFNPRIITLLMLMAVFSCKKSAKDDAPQPDLPSKGTVYPKGTPDGDPAQKTIGPEGGTLAIESGRLTLTVPPGAVAAATVFSMQPVTKTLPHSPGKGYRLLPENVTFTKPVTLTMQYNDEDLKGTAPQALFLAFQSNDGIWRYDPLTAIDETARKLTVETTHFSDWGIFAEFELTVPRTVKPGNSVECMLWSPFAIPPLGVEKPHPLEIYDIGPLKNPANIRNWKLSGEGALKPGANKVNATYTAPARVPQKNPVRISVEVWNFIPPQYRQRTGGTGKAIIWEDVMIGEETYFRGQLDGAAFSLHPEKIHFTRADDLIIVQGIFEDGKTLTFSGYINGKIERSYPFRVDDDPGRAVGVFVEGPNKAYFHRWYPCDANPVVSPGSVTLIKLTSSDNVEYLEGEFSCTLYREFGSCPFRFAVERKISGHFKVRRSG
ncbi:hypothetical protein [Chitinophaga sp. YIM B06452]|uniref:hypothetical protein n=1 Tax=Chitinophaga sp. YIM B06452 TaxID=3082158 RepID=UPI0031FEE6C3